MSQPAASAAVSGRAAAENRLHGRWLWLARIAWVAVTLTLVFLNMLAFPDLYASNFTFTPQMLQDLHRLGLSPTLYGWLITIMNF